MLVMALSIHSVLEGVAIGVSGNVEELITLFISIIVHEVSLREFEYDIVCIWKTLHNRNTY